MASMIMAFALKKIIIYTTIIVPMLGLWLFKEALAGLPKA